MTLLKWLLASALPSISLSAPVSFVAVGDWGGGSDGSPTTDAQVRTAVGMSKIARTIGAEGIFLMGDNFYNMGVWSNTSTRFRSTFEDVYLAKDFNEVPFYVVAGNHDYRSNVFAQLAYHDNKGRWRFPALWYSRRFPFISTTGQHREVHILFIDTVNLAGDCDVEYSGCFLTGPVSKPAAERQWTWIQQTLATSTADFLWVVGHYPIYSAGDDGTNHILVERLLPMLQAHGAHYMHGHDHMHEHLSYKGVEMYVSGMGRECCYGVGNLETVPDDSIKFMISGEGGQGPGVGRKPVWVDGGFASVVFDDHAKVKFYDQDGDVLYTAPKVAPRKEQVSRLSKTVVA